MASKTSIASSSSTTVLSESLPRDGDPVVRLIAHPTEVFMSLRVATRVLVLAIVALVAVDQTVAPTTTPTATAAASATIAAGAQTWTVSDKSKATVRVREQLANLN